MIGRALRYLFCSQSANDIEDYEEKQMGNNKLPTMYEQDISDSSDSSDILDSESSEDERDTPPDRQDPFGLLRYMKAKQDEMLALVKQHDTNGLQELLDKLHGYRVRPSKFDATYSWYGDLYKKRKHIEYTQEINMVNEHCKKLCGIHVFLTLLCKYSLTDLLVEYPDELDTTHLVVAFKYNRSTFEKLLSLRKVRINLYKLLYGYVPGDELQEHEFYKFSKLIIAYLHRNPLLFVEAEYCKGIYERIFKMYRQVQTIKLFHEELVPLIKQNINIADILTPALDYANDDVFLYIISLCTKETLQQWIKDAMEDAHELVEGDKVNKIGMILFQCYTPEMQEVCQIFFRRMVAKIESAMNWTHPINKGLDYTYPLYLKTRRHQIAVCDTICKVTQTSLEIELLDWYDMLCHSMRGNMHCGHLVELYEAIQYEEVRELYAQNAIPSDVIKYVLMPYLEL